MVTAEELEADASQRHYLEVVSKVRGLTDEQLLMWIENGSHADAAFGEQQFRNLRELKLIHALMREVLGVLQKMYAGQGSV